MAPMPSADSRSQIISASGVLATEVRSLSASGICVERSAMVGHPHAGTGETSVLERNTR